MRVLKWFEWAVLMAVAVAASGAEIAGRIVLSGEPAADAVVSIEGLEQQAPPVRSFHVINHVDLKFVPRLLVCRTGATVQFKNSDGMPCHIYSISPSGAFVLRPEGGKPMAVTFDRPGVIQVGCSEHGRIHAYVVIKENPYFARTDSRGRYRILDVPPGRHTLQAWHEGALLATRPVEVGAAKLKVNFDCRRSQAAADTLAAEGLLTGLLNHIWRQE